MQNKISVKIAGNSYTILADEPAEYMRKVAARTEVFMQEAHHLNGGNAYGTGVLATLNASDALVKAEMKLAQVRMESAAKASEEVATENEKLKAMLVQNEVEVKAAMEARQEMAEKLEHSEAHNQQLVEKLAKQASMLSQLREQLDKMKEATATLAGKTEQLRALEAASAKPVVVAPRNAQEEVDRLKAELFRQQQMNDDLQQRTKS